ncbi:MAG: porin family protein [Bacteroidota bacterium]
MRLLSSFLYLLILAIHDATAQEDGRLFTGALILGANFTQIDGDDYYGYHRMGLNAGGMAYAHFTPGWGASMELLYSQKGSRGQTIVDYPGIGRYVSKYYMKLNYVEVPVMVHYITHKLDMEAGLSYALLLKSDEYVVASQSVTIDPERNRFNTTDINGIIGISRQAYKNFHLNLRFQYSALPIRPVERIPAGYVWGTRGQFNNMLALRVLYYF